MEEMYDPRRDFDWFCQLNIHVALIGGEFDFLAWSNVLLNFANPKGQKLIRSKCKPSNTHEHWWFEKVHMLSAK